MGNRLVKCGSRGSKGVSCEDEPNAGFGMDQAEGKEGLGMDTSADGSESIGRGDSFIETLGVQGKKAMQSRPLEVSIRAQEVGVAANCNLGNG